MNDCDRDAYNDYLDDLRVAQEDRGVCYLQAARETGFTASAEEISRRFDELVKESGTDFADFWEGVFFTESDEAEDEAAALVEIEAARGTKFWTEDDSGF